MTRVKICGMRSRDDVATAVDAGADAVGFVTEVPVETPRNLSLGESRGLIQSVPPFVTSVLVLMPDDADEAIDAVREARPDAVQIHSAIPREGVERVGDEVTVVKKVSPDVDEAEEYAGAADALIVDSSGDDGGGGTGETHDWEETARVVESVDVPVVLAGGLTPDNVSRAVETVSPYAVDVASGVEDGEGKNAELVDEFVTNARGGHRV